MFTKKPSKNNIYQDDRQTLASISSAASSVTEYPISINDSTLMSNFINSDGLVSISQDSSNEDSIMSMLQYNKKDTGKSMLRLVSTEQSTLYSEYIQTILSIACQKTTMSINHFFTLIDFLRIC